VDNQQSNHPEQPPADARAGDDGIVRELFDVNTFFLAGRQGWPRWFAIRLILFVLGSVIGGILLRIIDKQPVGDIWFVGGLISNAYIWACVIATALYGVRDRQAHRHANTD
jgi:hypothetical protein